MATSPETKAFTPAAIVAPLTQPQLIALARSAVIELFKADATNDEADALCKLEEALGEYAYEVGREDDRQKLGTWIAPETVPAWTIGGAA